MTRRQKPARDLAVRHTVDILQTGTIRRRRKGSTAANRLHESHTRSKLIAMMRERDHFHHSRAALLRQGLIPRSLPSPECELRAVGEQLRLRQPQGEGDFHHPEEDAVAFLEPLVPGAGGLGFTKALLSISQLSEDTERARFRGPESPSIGVSSKSP